MYCCIDCPRLHHAVNLVFVIVTIITYPHNRILERGYPGSSTSNCCPACLNRKRKGRLTADFKGSSSLRLMLAPPSVASRMLF